MSTPSRESFDLSGAAPTLLAKGNVAVGEVVESKDEGRIGAAEAVYRRIKEKNHANSIQYQHPRGAKPGMLLVWVFAWSKADKVPVTNSI